MNGDMQTKIYYVSFTYKTTKLTCFNKSNIQILFVEQKGK